MSHPAPLPAPLYQGSVNTWECDDGGHLNVRFHFERAMVGLAHFARALEMTRPFTGRGGATLLPLEAHIRFLKEARPGAPLVMHGGVAKMGDSDAQLCLDMRHADGAPSSCFTLKVAHVDTRGFRPFPWSARSRAAGKRLHCVLPAHAKTRSIDISRAPSADASLQRAIDLGATRIGGALVTPDQCDAFGRLRGEHFVGRVSDFPCRTCWRNFVRRRQRAGKRPRARWWKRALSGDAFRARGDLIEVRSGIAEAGEKTLRLVHWLCDPESGAVWASMEAVALTFDTTTRKTIAPPPEARARLAKHAIAIAV